MAINTTLSTFMKIALTAVVIGSLVFGLLYNTMDGLTDDVSLYIQSN